VIIAKNAPHSDKAQKENPQMKSANEKERVAPLLSPKISPILGSSQLRKSLMKLNFARANDPLKRFPLNNFKHFSLSSPVNLISRSLQQ
jgi:hypothetical protein